MEPSSTIAFILLMLALAALPSASVALVVSRSASRGFSNGLAVTAGIVLADLIFAALAIAGMTALAQSAGMLFAAFRYLAGGYLIYLGISLVRSRKATVQPLPLSRPATLLTSFCAGLFLTFGDAKAILFYASLFPTLFDLRTFSMGNYTALAILTVVTVGGVKLAYAALARRLVARWQRYSFAKPAKTLAGTVMVGTGILVVTKG